jgi:hypothetical protein
MGEKKGFVLGENFGQHPIHFFLSTIIFKHFAFQIGRHHFFMISI